MRHCSQHAKRQPAIFCAALMMLFSVHAVAQPMGDRLDREVASAFRSKCAMCHDQRSSDPGGDVDFLMDFVALVDPENYLFDPTEPSASRLREILDGNDPEMPKRQMKDIAWNGPLTATEMNAVQRWVARGGPSDDYRASYRKTATRSIVTEGELTQAIALDLQSLEGSRYERARYLTLTNLHNNQSITADELELYRQAVVKLLNSLSGSSDILGLDTSDAPRRLHAVDPARTIFRLDLRDIAWTSERWDSVLKHYPYGILPSGGIGRLIAGEDGARMPYMRADWFVFATSQPPLYHDLLGIPANLQALDDQLRIDRLKNIRERRVHRAGFGQSGVSVNNRMVERHSTGVNGSYWISYDFGSVNGRQNLFENPLGPPGAFDTSHCFQHDGGEVIYTLPNGFQAYALVTAAGDRISIAPNTIVHDDSMQGGQIINGVSCISCHYAGMKPENTTKLQSLDRVRANVEVSRVGFSADEMELVGELYSDHSEFARLVEKDSQRFQNAMTQAGVNRQGSNEPVRALFDRFAKDIDVEAAAAGFGIDVEDFSQRMMLDLLSGLILSRI